MEALGVSTEAYDASTRLQVAREPVPRAGTLRHTVTVAPAVADLGLEHTVIEDRCNTKGIDSPPSPPEARLGVSLPPMRAPRRKTCV